MEYLIEYPSSPKGEPIAPSLTESPIGVAQHPASTDAATERSPKTFISDLAQATQHLLMEDSAANRAAAARKLAKLGNPSATSDSSPEVRMAAAESLGHLGDLAEMAHLHDLLARGTHSEAEERVISEAIHSIVTREGNVSETPPTIVCETQPINVALNPAHLVVDTNAQPNASGDARTETEFPSLTLEERLCREEAALREATQDFEHRRAETEKLRRAHDEKERLADLEANRHIAEREAQQRNEKEQKLLAEIEALRKAEAEQLKRIEEANAAARRRPAEEMSAPAENEARDCSASRRAEEGETQLAQPEAIRFDTESEGELRAAEKQRLSAEIKTLSKVATEQTDRVEQASARLTLLEQLRLHAETMVYERAEREIRLQAEIAALRQAEAAQIKRIEQAEAETQRLTEEEARVRSAAMACRNAEAEARQRAAAEALQQVEEELHRLAEEDKQRIEHLETIHRKAEAAAQERAETERLLTSQLLAFGEAAAEQIKRIERAEADLREAEKKALQFEEAARQKSEHEAVRLAETEARRKAAEERFSSAEAQTKQQVQEEEQTIAQLELIRGAAEIEAQQRCEKIQSLNADIEALRKMEVEQSQRIEESETRLHQMEAETRRLAQDEEQRLAALESFRSQAETRAQYGREKEQELIAALDALKELEAEQLNRLADAEAALLARAEELQAGVVVGIDQEENNLRTQLVAHRNDETEPLPNDLQIATSNTETAAAWSVSQFSGEADVSAGEEVEMVSDDVVGSSVVDPFETSEQTSTEDSEESLDPVRSKGNIQATSDETSIVLSLAERIKSGDPAERADALQEVAQLNNNDAFSLITGLFDDSSAGVRNAAARALYDLRPNRADTFARALREASPERRRQITRALDGSGVAAEAIENLAGESRDKTYDAFSLLFLMAKAGEFQLLLQTVEKHPNNPVRLSMIKLLTFCNQPEIIPVFRSLAVRGSLPTEIRSALMASIYEMSNNARENAISAA